jgi:hypothetical protein
LNWKPVDIFLSQQVMESDYGRIPPRVHNRLVRDFSTEDNSNSNGVVETRSKSPSQSPLRSALSNPPVDSGQWPIRNGDEFNHETWGPGVLSPIEETSYYAPSAASISEQARSIPEQTSISGTSSGRLTDFFGAEVFQMVLHNPTTCHQLTKFAQTRFCGENMEFLEQVRFNQGCEVGSTLADGHRLTATTRFSMR